MGLFEQPVFSGSPGIYPLYNVRCLVYNKLWQHDAFNHWFNQWMILLVLMFPQWLGICGFWHSINWPPITDEQGMIQDKNELWTNGATWSMTCRTQSLATAGNWRIDLNLNKSKSSEVIYLNSSNRRTITNVCPMKNQMAYTFWELLLFVDNCILYNYCFWKYYYFWQLLLLVDNYNIGNY